MCPQPLASTLNASTSAVKERGDAGSDGAWSLVRAQVSLAHPGRRSVVQAGSSPSLKADPTIATVVVEPLVLVDR